MPDSQTHKPAVKNPDARSDGQTGKSQTDGGFGDGGDSAEDGRPDPTRFGDWEKDGRCIDF